MADVVKLVFGSAYEGGGVRQFVAGAEGATKAALRTTGAARTLTSAIASAGGAAGGAVGDVARFVSAFSQLGAVGGIIAGVQIVIDRVCESIKKSADAAAEAVSKMAERIRTRLDSINEQRMEGVTKALEEATTKAKTAASAFDALASAYLKVSAAQDAAARSVATAALSGMELSKAKAMSAAGSDGERALAGAGWDVKIARQRANDVRGEQDRTVAAAEDEAAIRARQAKDAEKAEAKALRAKELAAKVYEEDVNGDNQRNVEKSKAAVAAAERAYAEAVNARVSKAADAEAAEARVREAQNNRTAAINAATRAIVTAEEAERRLVAAQTEAAKAELERTRAVKAQTRPAKAADDRSQQLLEGARGDFASRFQQAFDLWRDPAAAKAAQDEEKRRDEDMKRFRRDVGRYGGRWRIDEYAELMRRGDSEGMQEKLAEWRKSSKFTPQVEQMVKAAAAEQNANAAERALQNIEKNTADLAKKLDDLLSVK